MTALGLGLGLPFGGRISNPLFSLGATFAIDARDAINGAQWVLNRGTGGRLLDAQVGSVTRAEVFNGIGLKLPGTGTNSASVPDSAVFSPTDIDIRVRAALNNWGTNGANYQTLAAHSWDEPAAGTNYGWLFSHYGSRTLSLYLGDAGGGVTTSEVRSSTLAFTNGQLVDVRVTRIQSTGVTTFYWKDTSTALDSNTGWTSIGSGTVRAGGALFNGTGSLRLGACGSSGNSLRSAGVIERCLIKDGVDGTTTFDANFAAQSNLSTSFTATTGQTVTVVQASAVDTNDPLFLPHTGTNYLYAPENGGSCSVPDASNLDITGDIDCRFRVETNSATNGRVITKGYASVYCFGFTFEGLWTEFNSGGTFYPAGQSHGMPVGSRGWFRITRVASTGVVSYYKANDSTTVPTSWTFLGSVVSTIGNLATNASVLNIAGGPGGAEAIDANLYHVQLRDGIDGTVVFEADFTKTTESSQSSFVCTTGQTVTLTRATTGRKMVLVVRPLWLFGTDDYMEVLDNDLLDVGLNQAFTLVAITRSFGRITNAGDLVAKNGYGVSPNYAIVEAQTTYAFQSNLSDASVTYYYSDVRATPPAYGLLRSIAFGRNGSSTVFTYDGNVSLPVAGGGSAGTPASADISGTANFIIGNFGGPGGPLNAEVFAIAFFRKALTAGEIAQIVSYYGAT